MRKDIDAVSLLRELPAPDPGAFDADSPTARAALERILAAPAPPPPAPVAHGSRAMRRGLLAGAVAGAIVVAVALVPSGRDVGDVLASAAAALSGGDTIVHYRAQVRHDMTAPPGIPNPPLIQDMETWQTGDGRRARTLYGFGLEVAEDFDAGTSMAYSPQSNELIHHPGVDDAQLQARRIDSHSMFAWDVVGDLGALLERARRGDEDARLLGETTVRGIAVYELRIDFTADVPALAAPATPVTDPSTIPMVTRKVHRLVYIGRDDHLPVRAIQYDADGRAVLHVDYLEVERLPRNAENERLLEMSPHPDARVVRQP